MQNKTTKTLHTITLKIKTLTVPRAGDVKEMEL